MADQMTQGVGVCLPLLYFYPFCKWLSLEKYQSISYKIYTTLKLLNYIDICDAVNTAYQLLIIAQPNHIIIRAGCFQKVNDTFEFECLGKMSLKNKLVNS